MRKNSGVRPGGKTQNNAQFSQTCVMGAVGGLLTVGIVRRRRGLRGPVHVGGWCLGWRWGASRTIGSVVAPSGLEVGEQGRANAWKSRGVENVSLIDT